MNITKNPGSRRGPDLPYADFCRRVNSYQWEGWAEGQLVALLRQSVLQGGGKTAEAYSILKEIIKQKTGLSLFDSQLIAAYSMQQGRIAELPTGEGKTLAAVVAAAMFALQKKPVHILVFNDYLARRDYQANLAIYRACGLTCAYIDEAAGFSRRKAAYACDVVYVSAKEAAFDYLRDFLCTEKERLLFPAFPVALVDEADSILIDEARIPLVLAGNPQAGPAIAVKVAEAVGELSETDAEVNPADNQVWLTEAGISFMEARLGLANLYLSENTDVLAMVSAALEARFLLKKNKDYIVKNGSIWVVDESTGRTAEDRRFPDLLHQAVECRELGKQGEPAVIYHSMSMQAFLMQYKMLCGMTGTAVSAAAELKKIYGLEVDAIPPHLPCIRIDHSDSIFLEKAEQEAAVLACIQAAHQKGQPVLAGSQSVKESEHFSALLTQRGIRHCVLNAKNDQEEGAIIAEAGRPYRVTISTNMAGRGVDIRLGGRDGKEAEFVRAAGGLSVVGTGINRSLRIDNQLRGRSGRQGDPGESRFFVCLKDVNLDTLFDIEFYHYKKYPKLLRRAQRIQEGKDGEARYMLERYSQILEKQRKLVTDYRSRILLELEAPQIIREEAPDVYRRLIDRIGEKGVRLAERQLILYFINMNWASYLAAMEDKRRGIHLMIIGGKSPLEEYQAFALAAFAEMTADIKSDVVEHMQKCQITEAGIDMAQAGLLGATTTWTYMINESASQFSRIPHLIKSVAATMQGTLFTLRGLYAKLQAVFAGKPAADSRRPKT